MLNNECQTWQILKMALKASRRLQNMNECTEKFENSDTKGL